VHRLRNPQRPVTVMPDEAAAFLFGPLVEAIRHQADDAVEQALKKSTKPA
jgi:hypothetical protein